MMRWVSESALRAWMASWASDPDVTNAQRELICFMLDDIDMIDGIQ